MPALPQMIASLARSEMSRNALNNWEKFKLPKRNDRIEDLLRRLAAPKNDPR